MTLERYVKQSEQLPFGESANASVRCCVMLCLMYTFNVLMPLSRNPVALYHSQSPVMRACIGVLLTTLLGPGHGDLVVHFDPQMLGPLGVVWGQPGALV